MPSRHALAREGLAFAVVGGLGFLCDAAFLTLLHHGMGLHPLSARLFSFAAAVTLTWWLNRLWTFRHRASASRGREYARYVLLQSFGTGINFVAYAFCLWLHPTFRAYPVLALAVGSGTAMVVNYLSTRNLAFLGQQPTGDGALDAGASGPITTSARVGRAGTTETNMRKSSLLLATLALATAATPALAYIGPGAGVTMLGALWGVIVAIALAIGAVVFWPIRALMRRGKKRPAPLANETTAGEVASQDAGR